VPTSTLSSTSRRAALAAMTDTNGVDILVIGGGITGAGIALDAATRGLRVAIVEAQDWSAGTSSRSSRLVHGGLRYLYNLDFKLVAESLKERGLLLDRLAPHLVRAQPLLWPLKQRVIERAYSAVGVGLYDALAVIGNRRKIVPFQHHLSREAALATFPDVRPDALIGAIRFYDARVDDARLVITLVRTAVRYGALPASRTEVVDLLRDGAGRVTGALVLDQETGTEAAIRAEVVINATGAWTEKTQALAETEAGLRVLASKGAHIAVWRSTNSGATWRQITTQATAARWVDIAMPIGVADQPADQAVLATGPFCLRPLRRAKDVWISTRVDPNGANTLGVVAIGEVDGGGELYAATGSGIYRSLDGGRTWQPFRDGLGSISFIGITAVPRNDGYTLYALSLGGVIWKCDLI